MAYDAGGYDPYDNSNQFMQDWFKAASKPDADMAADPRQFRALTSSPRRTQALKPVVSPLQGFYYGNYKGVPNEWFYDFAKKKKAEFEKHVRSLGYEVDLADTPGLGKHSELPVTPDYLETIIPPAYNPGVYFREHYYPAGFDDADQQNDQARALVVSQASLPQATDDTESEDEEIQPSPVLRPFRNNPFDEEDTPVLQFTAFNRRESIDNHSPGRRNEDDDFSADLNDDSVNTANLIAYGQQQASTFRDDIAFHQYGFINAGVDLTTCDIIDNHMASQGIGLEGPPLVIDEQDELEKDQASGSFFGGTRVDESPTPHHQPVVDQESGFANIREGLENFPQQWTFSKENLSPAEPEDVDTRAGSWPPAVEEYVDMTRDSDNPVHRTILKPVSQKAKAKALNQMFPELIGDIPSFIDHRQRKYRAKPPAPIVTHNLSTKASFLKVAFAKQAASAKKRQADYTFVTKSASLSSAGGTKFRGSKKSRPNDSEASLLVKNHSSVHQSAQYDDTQDYPSFARDPDDVESPHLHDRAKQQTAIDFSKSGLPLAEEVAKAFYHNQTTSPGNRYPTISPITPEAQLAELPTPLTPEPPAYAGQFNGISLCDLYHLAHQKVTNNMPEVPLKLTFGDHIHANPLITHPCIPSHPPTLPIGAFNYTHNTLPPSHHLHARLDALSCTVDLAASTPVALHRTPSQEALRTEAHRELAAARLEGFPVGEYRYYQGHLSVEEYIENGMCVCWSACGCSGWCSRFGDLICPCSRVLEPCEDEDEDDGDDEDEDDVEAGYESEEGFAQVD